MLRMHPRERLGKTMRLVVDDEVDSRDLVTAILTRCGGEVNCFSISSFRPASLSKVGATEVVSTGSETRLDRKPLPEEGFTINGIWAVELYMKKPCSFSPWSPRDSPWSLSKTIRLLL